MGREAHRGGSQDAKPEAEALALDTAPALRLLIHTANHTRKERKTLGNSPIMEASST